MREKEEKTRRKGCMKKHYNYETERSSQKSLKFEFYLMF